MRRPRSDVLFHGIIGGIVAGAVIALWFLIVDLADGAPFRTPEALAQIAFRNPAGMANAQLITTYTILHLGMFALLGLIVSVVMDLFELEPSLRLGALVGVGVLNAAHYGAILATGSTMLTVLPPLHVLGANLCAGLALMTYLHFSLRPEVPFGVTTLRDHPLLRDGLITGAIGAGVVALWFLLLDVARGAPLFTPAALGSVVFLGAGNAAQVQMSLGIILAYTALHIAAFAVVGVVFEWSAGRLEHAPGMWLMALLVFITLDGIFLGTIGSLGQWVLGALGIWAVAIANLLAIGAMSGWLLVRHPRLRAELRAPLGETHV